MRKRYLGAELVEYLRTRSLKARRSALVAQCASDALEQMEKAFGLRPGTPDCIVAGVICRNQRRAQAELKAAEKYQRCGAKTRAGKLCQCRPEEGRDRCKFHGGLSTGPLSEAGREAIRESNRRRAQKRREHKEASSVCP